LGRVGIGDSNVVVRRLAVDTLATVGWPGTYGSLTRDGRYMSGVDLETGNLVVRDMRTGTRRRLTAYEKWTDNVGHNVIAPDGSAIAFVVNADNNSPSAHSELKIIAVNGSDARTVARTHDPSEYIRPADWSPDNRQLVALATRKDKSHEIALVSVDGAPTRLLKSLAWRSPEGLKFSPNGRSLAYDAPLSQESTARDLFILDSDGTRESRVTNDGAPKFLVGWDASGSGLFYTTRANGAMTLWYAPVSGGSVSAPSRLIRSDIWGGEAIGIGGNTLFYAVSNRRDSFYSVAVDLAEARAIASSVTIPAAGIFSPDGGQLAYVRPLDVAGPSDEAIAIRDIATGDERRIPSPIEYIHLLRWDADGRSILAFARRRGQLGLFHVDLASGGATLVDPDADGWLQFSPDGKTMLFGHAAGAVRAAGPLGGVGNQGKPTVIVVRDLETRREREVYRGERASFLLSPDGKTLVLASNTMSDQERRRIEDGLAAFEPGRAPRVVLWPELVTWKVDIADVAWSPDSRSIVWAKRDATGGREVSEIRIASLGATGFHKILSVAGWIRQGLHVSPDGRRLVYAVRPSEKSTELWTMQNLPK
jgi:Tol biopolymer transport system component